MFREYVNDGIILYEAEHFRARDIFECGQVFRYRDEGTHYSIISADKKCDVVEEGGNIRLITADAAYFDRYFDLDTSYGEIIKRLRPLPLMERCTEYGKGIRILRQDTTETIFDFIISANNHIPRIKGIIERICEALGEKKEGFYAFPSVDALAQAGKDFYASIGAGYRADYLDCTARAIRDGFDVDALERMPSDEANRELCKLKGVGEKVADCILLFGCHRSDVFPVDTWIKKVYRDIFDIDGKNNKVIRKRLIDTYGDLSGYAQQYLFYGKREGDM